MWSLLHVSLHIDCSLSCGVSSMRKVLTVFAAAAVLLAAPVPSQAGVGPTAGAEGAGDSYYPDYGKGGYDGGHYDLKLKYQPATDQLTGKATIQAKATKQL